MNIDKAIKHAEKVAEEHTQYNKYGGFESCDEYAKEYRQLVNWLKELKMLREQERPHGEWIPVSERLPEENKTVIASTKYGVYSEARYSKEYGWEWAYESGSDYWVELEEVNAWMPLPEPYKKEGDAE